MCQRITCKECGKPSFAGCGRHVESVLGDVPRSERCAGHAAKSSADGNGEPAARVSKLLDFLSGGRQRRGT